MAGVHVENPEGIKVYKAHRICHFKDAGFRVEPRKAKLILLLRDPYECVASDMRHHPKLFRTLITYIQLMKYLENIAYYIEAVPSFQVVGKEGLVNKKRSRNQEVFLVSAQKRRL
jgi:hypothetical protein